MDNCKHINKLTPSTNHSILNPQKWMCCTCGTTESVWACMSCANVACGRYNEEHAVKHYNQTKHPLAIEVNEKYVYCYVCDDYVLNDNAAGDLKILRSALDAVATHSFEEVGGKGRRLLRSHSYHGFDPRWQDEKKLLIEDRNYTALWFRRYYLLGKCFGAWRHYLKARKKEQDDNNLVEMSPPESDTLSQLKMKRAIIPGVTGLRNLGNTCYMNSVLQVLSHLNEFRQYFLDLDVRIPQPSSHTPDTKKGSSAKSRNKTYERQTTMDCYQYISDGANKEGVKGGLNGGGTSCSSPSTSDKIAKSSGDGPVTLSQELHALLRVMWSGKWALVSPHKMLNAVWDLIPFFKGYSQQDAQEFLCELLDKIQGELTVNKPSSSVSRKKQTDVITAWFQGQFISEVRCLGCHKQSMTHEPFMELSLEFPDRYQVKHHGQPVSSADCHIEEMLSKFTEVEKLDGKIYACDQCNRKRRCSPKKSTTYSEAEKGFMVNKLPRVLRLHLKRFIELPFDRWSGRNHRGKINIHVNFEEELNMKPYCHPGARNRSYIYKLTAVVMHHGKGFGSGHYTAYCWNDNADTWVHCNDARMEFCDISDVTRAQAYILIYTQKLDTPSTSTTTTDSEMDDFKEEVDEDITFNYVNSTIPKFVEMKRKRCDDDEDEGSHKRRQSSKF